MLNMTKENRKELRSLNTQAHALAREANAIHRRAEKELGRVRREAEKQLNGLSKHAGILAKRLLIVGGRMSK